jgi:hypothetical protein
LLINGVSLRDPQVLGTLAAAGVLLGGIVVYLAMRKRPTEDEIERERRLLLVQGGRIIDGTLLDITDVEASESGRDHDMRLILYKYEVAGVVYECSQDITTLQDSIDQKKCRPGFPASIRYDTRRPENSIIVAEQWSGLRESARTFTIREPVRKKATASAPRRP